MSLFTHEELRLLAISDQVEWYRPQRRKTERAANSMPGMLGTKTDAEVTEMVRKGWEVAAIAAACGRKRSAVANWKTRNGLARRKIR